MNLDRQNFEEQVFDELPEAVLCSNFHHCTFNVAAHFERCNLIGCTFNAECTFDRSNVISAEEEQRQEEERARIEAEIAENN